MAPVQATPKESSDESRALNAEASLWQRDLMADPAFLRNLDAVLQPSGSAIFALLTDADAAVRVLRGYSGVLLRTPLKEAQASKLRTSRSISNDSPGGGRLH